MSCALITVSATDTVGSKADFTEAEVRILKPVLNSVYSIEMGNLEPSMNPVGRNNLNKNSGFSLIELMVVTAIMGILMALAAPGFQDTIEAANTNSQVKVLLSTLNLARSEAIKRGTNVAICASNDGLDCDAGAWSDGWIVFVDANGDANGGTGSVDVGDTLIRAYSALGAGSALTFTTGLYEYGSQGFGVSAIVQTLKLCPRSNNANNARSIEIGISGRGRRIETGLVCP